MKKKLLLIALTLVCAIACACSLAACGDDTPKVNGIMIVPTGEQPDVTKQHDRVYTEITYGETPDLLFYKLYLYYNNGDTKELALSDEKLTVAYSYSGFNTTESKTMENLPDKWIAGYYSIAYTYDGKSDSQYKATANIGVNWAQSGAFGVQLTKSTWFDNEKSPNVILKNPKGLTVTNVGSIDAVEKSDDSDGCYYLRYVEKQVYDTFTEAQKTDYEFLENNSDMQIYVADMEFPVGEYMLFAMIDRTYNYDSVVTPAVKITVKDTIIERTFTFGNMVLKDGSGNVLTDENDDEYGEYVTMTTAMNTSNTGKTVICKANGEVRGTVDFGGGAFDELIDEDVYKYIKNGANVTIGTGSLDSGALTGIGEGVLSGNTFTLTMPIYGTAYEWVVTFTA